jgi:hypothetical protein
LLLAALALAGCDKVATKEDADVADANARTALARVAELEDRVSDLETELADLKSKTTGEMEAEERTRRSVDQSLAKGIDDLAAKHNIVVDRVYGQ